MENKNFKSILEDALEEEIPSSQVNLWPAVKASLVAGRNTSLQQGEKMKPIQSRRIQRVASATVMIIALMIIALITPQGRAFAQRIIFLFFTVTEEKSFLIPTEQVYSVPGIETPVPTYILPLQPVEATAALTKASELLDQACTSLEARSVYFCQIKTVEAQAGFDAKELPDDPEGLNFSKATFDSTTKTIDMEFVVTTGGGYLYLSQGLGEFPLESKWGKVPADSIEQVAVNGQYAELASGTFIVYPNETSAVWEPGGTIRLRWREGNHWFSLTKIGEPYPIEWMGENEIVELAESLMDERPLDEIPPVDPKYLTSVEAAEELARFDVLVPTLLPVGYELKRAAWADNVVSLFYGYKDSTHSTLLIFMGRSADHKVEPSGGMEDVQIGPWQGRYWRGISHPAPTTPGQPTPVPNPRYWHLIWNTDTLSISLLYTSPSDDGGQMDKETLIKIAESLK